MPDFQRLMRLIVKHGLVDRRFGRSAVFWLPEENRAFLAKCIRVIDLLLQVGYFLLVLAVLSFFFCTLPVWLIVVVVILLVR